MLKHLGVFKPKDYFGAEDGEGNLVQRLSVLVRQRFKKIADLSGDVGIAVDVGKWLGHMGALNIPRINLADGHYAKGRFGFGSAVSAEKPIDASANRLKNQLSNRD